MNFSTVLSGTEFKRLIGLCDSSSHLICGRWCRSPGLRLQLVSIVSDSVEDGQKTCRSACYGMVDKGAGVALSRLDSRRAMLWGPQVGIPIRRTTGSVSSWSSTTSLLLEKFMFFAAKCNSNSSGWFASIETTTLRWRLISIRARSGDTRKEHAYHLLQHPDGPLENMFDEHDDDDRQFLIQHNDMQSHSDQLEHMEPLAIGDQRLERKIGWVTGAIVNASYIIGAGIFVGPSLTLGLLGSGGMLLVMWFCGALLAMAGTWTFAELGTMLPRRHHVLTISEFKVVESLGTWSIATENPTALQLKVGKAELMAGMVFGSYLNYAIHGPEYKSDWAERGWALLGATLLTAVNVTSVKTPMRIMTVLTTIKFAILTLILCVGLLAAVGVLPRDPQAGMNLSFTGTTTDIGPYASALYYVMNSYSGWHNLNNIMDEVKDPIKSLPKASAAALGSVAFLYLAANAAYLVVLPLDVMKDSEFVVAAAFFTESLGENFASTILPVLIALGALGCAEAIAFSGGRIIMETARAGLLPYGRTLGHVNPRLKSPVNAYLLQYALTILFTVALPPGGVYKFIIQFIAYPVYVFYFLITAGLLILRKREPNANRPIKAPLPFVWAFLAFCAYALIFVFIPVENPYYPYWGKKIRFDTGNIPMIHTTFTQKFLTSLQLYPSVYIP
ncbi:hypothetical protein VTP01DRAFT_3598 [Rhizomucor pusillus]|uniref:uncharacterized protein n=1 Tax=Rhizomucor pusillus TaxID=4840 RepID=UPI003742DC80